MQVSYEIQAGMSDSLGSTEKGFSLASPCKPSSRSLISLLRESSSAKLRSFRTVHELVPLMQELPFFAEMANNFRLLSELAQKVEYAHRSAGEHVYRIRQPSNYFYIVLEGKVHLTIPEEIEPLEAKQEEKEEAGEYLQQKPIFPDFLDKEKVVVERQRQNGEKPPAQDPPARAYIEKIVRVIEGGGCFGQMMGEVSIRATNAVAVEECHLLTVTKKAYDSLLKAQLRTDNRSKFLFLSTLPQLAPLHAFPLETIALRLQERQLAYGQPLFQEGEEIRRVFIVHSGEFRLMKAVAKHSASAVERRTRGMSQYQSFTLPTKEVPFVIVQAGEILGDGEALALQTTYQQLCLCESQTARVFAIDKREYFQSLTADREAFARIRALIEEKYRRRRALTLHFLQQRSRQSAMNTLLNSNEWASRPKQFLIREQSVNSSVSSLASLTAEEIIRQDNFFLNQLNKTFVQNVRPNRFSINKQKCRTETSTQRTAQLIKSKKKDGIGVPHCVQDIVSIVKLKANFLKRFRKDRKRERNVFKFDKDAVPLFVKSKYNKIQDQK